MHIFFLNTYQNKQTRVLGKSPAQEQTNDTPPTKIRYLKEKIFLKTNVYSFKKSPVTTKRTLTKNDRKK